MVSITLNIFQIQKILSCHNQGLSIRQIAKKTRTDKNTVLKYIHSHESQLKHSIQMRSIECDARRIPINSSTLKEKVSSTYPKHHYQQVSAERNRHQSVAQDIPYGHHYRGLEEQRFFKHRYQDQIDEKNQMLEKMRYKQQQLELGRKKQDEEKRADDFLQKFELMRQQNDMEQRIKEEESNKKIITRIQEAEQNILRHRHQVDDFKNSFKISLKEAVKKIDNPEQNEEKIHNKPEQKDSQQCFSNKILKETASESDTIPAKIILPFVNCLLDLYNKFDDFSRSPLSHLPKNSPAYWQQLSKYLRGTQ